MLNNSEIIMNIDLIIGYQFSMKIFQTQLKFKNMENYLTIESVICVF